MGATENLEAAIADLKTAVVDLAAQLALQHTELMAAIAANDPARIQAAADAIGALTAQVRQTVSDNPDPAATPTA